MFYQNLFWEQIDVERAKELDPVRWSVMIGILFVMISVLPVVWNLEIYRKCRAEHQKLKVTHQVLHSDVAELRKTDAGQFDELKENLAMIEKRVREHPRVANLLSETRFIIPPQTQVVEWRFQYEVFKKVAWVDTPRKKKVEQTEIVMRPYLSMTLQTEGADSVQALKQRDELVQSFKTNQVWSLLTAKLIQRDHSVEVLNSSFSKDVPGKGSVLRYDLKLNIE